MSLYRAEGSGNLILIELAGGRLEKPMNTGVSVIQQFREYGDFAKKGFYA